MVNRKKGLNIYYHRDTLLPFDSNSIRLVQIPNFNQKSSLIAPLYSGVAFSSNFQSFAVLDYLTGNKTALDGTSTLLKKPSPLLTWSTCGQLDLVLSSLLSISNTNASSATVETEMKVAPRGDSCKKFCQQCFLIKLPKVGRSGQEATSPVYAGATLHKVTGRW